MVINNSDLCLKIYQLLGIDAGMMYKIYRLNLNIEELDKYSAEFFYENFEEKEARKINLAKENFIKNRASLFSDAKIYFENAIKNDIKWTSLLREDYPKKLYNLLDPPTFLFYKGHLPFEFLPSVAVIGARECSEYGEQAAIKIASELAARGVQIISGMARGIDGIAQKTAIDFKGNTYGILGCGPDVIYPRENNWLYWKIIGHGGILSEYGPGVKPEKFRFPARNRIISGISDLVLVVEARKKSGTCITVTQALEQGKEVFAVPGRINDELSEGCNELLYSGAGVACDASVIIDSLLAQGYVLETDIESDSYKKKNSFRNERNAQIVIEELKKNSKTADEIIKAFNGKIQLDELFEVLTDMQIDGAIEKRGALYNLIWS